MALFNLRMVPFPFPRALYKKLLDLAPTLEDLEDLLPTMGRYEPVMAQALAGSLALTMHWEIPEAEFGAPTASTFAFVKLLEATKEVFGQISKEVLVQGMDVALRGWDCQNKMPSLMTYKVSDLCSTRV